MLDKMSRATSESGRQVVFTASALRRITGKFHDDFREQRLHSKSDPPPDTRLPISW